MSASVIVAVEAGDVLTGDARGPKSVVASDGQPLDLSAKARIDFGRELSVFFRSPAKLRELATLATDLADELSKHGGEP